MLNFNQRVQQFLKQHRENKKHAVIAVMLALMVAFSVCGSLIMPAVSMTGSTEETAPALEMAESEVQMVGKRGFGPSRHPGSNKWFDAPVTEIPAGAQEMKPEAGATAKITSATFKYNGEELSGPPYELKAGGDEATLEVTLNYALSQGGVTVDNPCIYYELPEGMTISSITGSDFGSKNQVLDGNITAGYYSIDKTGLVVIQFTDDYINNYVSKSEITGHITFNGSISRTDNSTGDKDVTIGGITIKVDFPEKEVEIEKSGKIQEAKTPTDNPRIQWTIKVDNPYYNDTDESKSMNGYVLTDDLFPEAVSGVTVTPSGAGVLNGTSFTFSNTREKQITFTFEQEVTQEDWLAHMQSGEKFKNTATIKKGDVQKEKYAEVAAPNKPYFNKTGKADYETGISDDKVNWNITVEEPTGCSLKGWKVKDEAFSSLEANQITLKDENGNTVEFSKDGDTITISSDVKKVEVSYQMKLDPTQPKPQKLKNRAYLLYPDGSTAGNTGEKEVEYKKLYTLTKKGDGYDRAANKLKWKITASSDKNNTKSTLNGYTLTDEAFANIKLTDLKDISFTLGHWLDGAKVLSQSEDKIELGTSSGSDNILYATITKSGNTLTIQDANPYQAGVNETNIRAISELAFSYETDAATAGTDGTAKNGDTVTNTVSDNKGNSSSGNIDVGNRDQITKKFVEAEGGEEFYNADDPSKNNKTLHWEIDVTSDTGFSSDSKVLVDVMTAEGTGASHYFTIGTNSISVKAKTESGKYEQLTLGTDYEITYYSTDSQEESAKITDGKGNAKCFAITFTKTVDDKAYRFAEIEYSTMADVSGVKMDGKTAVSSKFSNTASFGTLNPSTPSYDLIEKSKDTVEKQTLTVNKTYSDGNTDKKPSVTFQLQRKKQGSNATDWAQIYLVDGEWTEVTADESNPYTFTLDSSNGWKQTFSDLPKDTLAHDGNYLYRVVETPVDGYTASYSDSQKGVGSGSITITNTPKQDFKKAALDADGNVLADGDSIALSDLPTLTVGGTTYYLIQWKIYDIVKNYTYELEDALPENSILIESDAEDNKYKPHASWNGYTGVLSTSGNEYYQYDSSTRKLTIYMNNAGNPPLYVTYYTGIPVETLKSAVSAGTDGYTVTNTIAQKGSDAKTASVKVTGSTADTGDKNLLTKEIANSGSSGTYDAPNGKLQYSVYVNPEGKYLSNTGEIDLTDDLTLNGYGTASADGIDAMLSLVKVEKIEQPVVDASGAVTDATVVRELSTSEYQYLVEHNISETIEVTDSNAINKMYSFSSSGDGQEMIIENCQSGDVITARLKGTPNTTIQKLYIFFVGQKELWDTRVEILNYSFDENGNGTQPFTFTVLS